MLSLLVFTTILLQAFYVSGTEIEIIRNSCFKEQEEKNCDKDFVDVYKDLSRSVTGRLADTYFLLYTRKNPVEPEKLHKCAGKLPPNSNFNPRKRIIFITLSFMTDFCQLGVYREWKDEILKAEDANVIAVDYNWEGTDYLDVHANLRLVAKQTILVLNNIKEQTGAKKFSVTVLGISLGAQLGGYIGRDYDLDRVIGLDPAGPLFNNAPENERLNPNDAKLVDVWHCNAGKHLERLGTYYDAGHVNYYINGGSHQESCHEAGLEALDRGDIFYAIGSIPACSHEMCMQYFKESINPGKCQYIGVKCSNYKDFLHGKCSSCGPKGENCVIMGYDAGRVIKQVPQKPQRYYVKTNFESPYCRNDYVDLHGYKNIYKSSLAKNTCKRKEPKNVNFLDKLKQITKDIFL